MEAETCSSRRKTRQYLRCLTLKLLFWRRKKKKKRGADEISEKKIFREWIAYVGTMTPNLICMLHSSIVWPLTEHVLSYEMKKTKTKTVSVFTLDMSFSYDLNDLLITVPKGTSICLSDDTRIKQHIADIAARRELCLNSRQDVKGQMCRTQFTLLQPTWQCHLIILVK